MKIPEYLLYPGITEEDKDRLVPWIEKKREKMQKAPTFETEDKAISAAIQRRSEGKLLPTVWKEPEDIGSKYAVVETELREDAQISGYTETVDHQKIYDIAYRGTDEIEEV